MILTSDEPNAVPDSAAYNPSEPTESSGYLRRVTSPMHRYFSGRSTNGGFHGGYSGVVLSSKGEIRQLSEAARRLNQADEPLLDPEFYLATVSEGWRPRVAAVYSQRNLVGILYAKERVISGIPTGVVFGDGSLGGILLGNSPHRQNSFRAALEILLASPRIRGVRLRVLRASDELEAVKQMIATRPLDTHYSRLKHNDSTLWKYHAHLALADTYEEFLKRLGAATRHNFRYYRRRFEASGHQFVDRLSMDDLRAAALDLLPKSKYKGSAERFGMVDREINLVATARRPLVIGLRHRNGGWLSVLGGWYRPRGAVLCFQCNNDFDHANESLSVVLRAFLIERLILQGLEELVIWSDTGPPLSRYVTYVPTIGVRLDAPTYLWRTTRGFLSTIKPWLPKRFAVAAQWIA